MACCLPTCAQGSSAAVTGGVGYGGVLDILGAPSGLVHVGVLALLVPGLGLRRCAYRWTRPSGGGRWGHNSRDPQGVHWCARKYALHDLSW